MRTLLAATLLLPLVAMAQRYDPPIAPLTLELLMAQAHPGLSDAQWMTIVNNPTNACLFGITIYEDMLDTMDVSQLDRRFFYTPMPRRPGTGVVQKDPSEQKAIRQQGPRIDAHGPCMPMKVKAK